MKTAVFLCPYFVAVACFPEITTHFVNNNNNNNEQIRRNAQVEDSVCPRDDTTCDTTGTIQQTTQDVIDDGTVAACRGSYPDDNNDDIRKSFTFPQSWARCIVLEEEGCSQNRVINSVIFGVRDASENAVSLQISVFKDCGCLFDTPGQGPEQLIGSASISVSESDSLSLQTVPITNNVVLAPSEAIRVEITQLTNGSAPEFSEDNPLKFSPAATASGATAPTYFLAPDCNLFSFSTWEDAGFPNSHIILTLQSNPAPENAEPNPLSCCTEGLCIENAEFCGENLQKCELKPECEDPPVDSCGFYRQCLEAVFECGDDGYPLKFAEGSCNNTVNFDFLFSQRGQEWARDARKCLQDVLVPLLKRRECFDCETMRQFAVDTHVNCYIDTGYCFRMASIRDFTVLSVLLSSGLFDPDLFQDSVRQFLQLMGACGQIYFSTIVQGFNGVLNRIMAIFGL